MRKLDVLAGALLIVGGLNWGLVAIAEFDLVAWIFSEDFGSTNVASRIVYGLVRKMGGSVSAEHGIGTLKKKWLGHARSEGEIALMHTLKAALDPDGLLNPGKVI